MNLNILVAKDWAEACAKCKNKAKYGGKRSACYAETFSGVFPGFVAALAVLWNICRSFFSGICCRFGRFAGFATRATCVICATCVTCAIHNQHLLKKFNKTAHMLIKSGLSVHFDAPKHKHII